MSTDSPADELASSPAQELVLLASRAPGSRRFHRQSQNASGQAACNRTEYDGQLVPRFYAELAEDAGGLGRRPCPDCFDTQENDTQ